jgi:hypothetical protein
VPLTSRVVGVRLRVQAEHYSGVRVVQQLLRRLSVPSTLTGATEERLCLASGLTDSIARCSLSVLLTLPETQKL